MAEGDALAGTTAGTPTMFTIRAADYHGNTRLNGGDEFEVVFRGVDKDNNPIEQKAVVKDNQDGVPLSCSPLRCWSSRSLNASCVMCACAVVRVRVRVRRVA